MTPAQSQLTPDLIDRVRKLSAEDQDRLIDLMLLDREAEPPTVRDELARRLADLDVGRVELLDGDEVIRRMEAKYGRVSE